jgi:serine/threonine-protein kinase
MAYVDGKTLGERIATEGPLSPPEASRVLREVAWALAYAHAQGVVHRDVKPDNILLEEATGRTLVMDFGIAQVAEVASDEHAEVLGTPEFMSPEQAVGEPVDGRSDIYSLGVTAYYALAGQPLFAGGSPSEILAHHIGTPAPNLASAAPGVSRTLSATIEQCLAKNPDDRFQRGELLAEALAETIQVHKQTPVAVRLFVKDAREKQERGLNMLYPVLGAWLGGPLLFLGDPVAQLIGATIFGIAVSVPLFSVVRRLRRVIKTGFGHYDITQAFRDDLASRNEELRYIYGDNYERNHRILRRVAYGALGVSAASLAVAFPISSLWPFVITTTSALAAACAGWQADKRTDKQAKRRLKFWQGRSGKWSFALAGFGLQAKPLPNRLTNRPTEIAIGMAVSSLFQSLPKATRDEMADLPDVLESLETDARRLRSQVDEFDQLLALAGDVEGDQSLVREDSLAGQRYRAAARIRSARDEAQKRFSDTVAALENLRVDLLRMRAGTVNLESVTTNLGAARDLGGQIDRLLEAHREIERDLKPTLTGEREARPRGGRREEGSR